MNRKGAEPEAKKRPVWFPVAFLHKSGGSKRAGTPAFHKSGKFIELFCNLVLTFGSNNGRVLRWINAQRQLYTALKSITSDLRADGISTKETCKSIGYLSAKGYISVSKNGQAVKITAQGIRLLAGTIEDSGVTV